VAAALVLSSGCASGSARPAGGPPQPELEADALRATTPARPVELVFAWNLEESDARFSGKGSTRLEPPGRARLDLFGPRGETYLSAVMIDMDLQMPPGVQDAPLPPAALLWAALGIFRPPVGAQLAATSRDGATMQLDYARDDERWTFRFEEGALRYAEWVGPRDGKRTVELDGRAEQGLPRTALYRDWPAFRSLKLTLEQVHETDGFPADIWAIGR
jgi:hypothetical protein